MALGQFAYANNSNRFLGCAPLADQPWGHRNLAVLDPTGVRLVLFQVL